MSTIIICLILAIACFLGVRSTMKRTRNGCCGGGGDEVKKVKVTDKDISHYPFSCTLEVDGMTCGNCKKRVENAFNSQEGIYASVDFEKKIVRIHMKENVSDEDLKDIVRKIGYFPGNINKTAV